MKLWQYKRWIIATAVVFIVGAAVIASGLWGLFLGVPLFAAGLIGLGFLILEIWVMVVLLAETLKF